jgi:hypothetical protein
MKICLSLRNVFGVAALAILIASVGCEYHTQPIEIDGAADSTELEKKIEELERQLAEQKDAEIIPADTGDSPKTLPEASPEASNDEAVVPTETPTETSCTDGVLNGDETDVDCGGPCGGCNLGQFCEQPSD